MKTFENRAAPLRPLRRSKTEGQTDAPRTAGQARLANLQIQMNRRPATARLQALQRKLNPAPVQRMEGDEEDALQPKAIQRMEGDEEDALQPKAIQRIEGDEEDALQTRAIQRRERRNAPACTRPTRAPIQRKGRSDGLPAGLKSGIEGLSGIAMDGVRVHRNSAEPARVGAHAYAQGTDIHLAPGQDRHLPHEAWHMVQQAQGRVRPTMDVAGTPVNDDQSLELEADKMGAQALQKSVQNNRSATTVFSVAPTIIQRKTIEELDNVATFRNGGQVNAVRTNYATMTIGATHTGDMYHVKAAKSLFPNLNTLIWGVTRVNNNPTLNAAYQTAEYVADQNRTFYKTGGPPGGPTPTGHEIRGVQMGNAIGWNKWINEGRTTSLILHATENSGNAGAAERAAIEQGVAPTGDRGRRSRYSRDLRANGFSARVPYILVNFRATGHNAGGVHPVLDTGTTGYDELIAQARLQFPGATIVPMGDIMPAGGGPFPANLVNYWGWDCCAGGRGEQAGLLKFLNTHFTVLGAVGMRSGIMDMLAFAGIKVVSIDISPAKPGPSSAGWERGSKLEAALGNRYGRAFMSNARVGEVGAANPWAGGFAGGDDAVVGGAMAESFGAAPLPPHHKNDSHPLSVTSLNALITRLTGAAPPMAGPLPNRLAGLADDDKRHMKRIKDLITVNYTFVPNAPRYRAIIDHLIAHP